MKHYNINLPLLVAILIGGLFSYATYKDIGQITDGIDLICTIALMVAMFLYGRWSSDRDQFIKITIRRKDGRNG